MPAISKGVCLTLNFPPRIGSAHGPGNQGYTFTKSYHADSLSSVRSGDLPGLQSLRGSHYPDQQ